MNVDGLLISTGVVKKNWRSRGHLLLPRKLYLRLVELDPALQLEDWGWLGYAVQRCAVLQTAAALTEQQWEVLLPPAHLYLMALLHALLLLLLIPVNKNIF